ncbi:MAG TPA: hypothetical protein VFD97_00830 [Acidimicrobiia bacterium]|nr:hypothetical protein [Acidimicrobiia bacterium]
MGVVLNRLIQAIRFDRDAFVWMDFNDRATGDALILVAITEVLFLFAGGTSLFGLVTGLVSVLAALLSTVMFWLIYSGLVYAIAVYLFRGDGHYPVYLRIAGFAFPTLLLMIATTRMLGGGLIGTLAGSVWFLLVVAYGTHFVSDLPFDRSVVTAVLGWAGWIVVSTILGGFSLF